MIPRFDPSKALEIIERDKVTVSKGVPTMYEHPAVEAAAVIGVPDEKMGEEVGAAVVRKEGEEASEDELRDFVKGEVASFKYPRRIRFVDELPKGPTGKILKREIEAPEPAKSG